MAYFAKSDGTTVCQHVCDVSELARQYGLEVGMGIAACVSGLLHDVAKYSDTFQDVLRGLKSNIDHACTSAALFDLMTKHRFRYISEVIAAHHGDLMAYEYLQPVFAKIVSGDKHDTGVTCPSGKTACAVGQQELVEIFNWFKFDFPDFKISGIEKFRPDFSGWKGKLEYMLRVRMLLSCLVDADYTASGLEAKNMSVSYQSKRIDAGACLDRLELYRTGIIQSSSASVDKNKLRNIVYNDCAQAGLDLTHGFYTLTAPTGSGKTLGMLKFALTRCLHDSSKRRVIIVLPFLSISDQIVEIVREIIPDVIIDNSQVDLDESQREIASTWDADCVVTTTVQFFGSLFSCRPSDCRKLHRIANSVILFDEIQALPVELSRVLMQVLRDLSRDYNACVCLSTATQPAYGKIVDLDFRAHEILQDVSACFAMSVRTGFEFRPELKSLIQVADSALCFRNACVIVNLKAHANEIYEYWRSKNIANCFLISTNLCGLHRLTLLREIKRLQSLGQSVHVVSTQCIEAGVDLDFEQVFRAMSPLPSLIQAAGRQNRNGLGPASNLIIFEPDVKSRYPGVDYEKQSVLAKLLLSNGVDLSDLSGIDMYYAKLFDGLFDSEPFGVSLDAMDFGSFARDTRLIKRSGYRVIVPYESGFDAYREILDAVVSGHVTKRHLRLSGGISVQSYDKTGIDAHCQELVLRNYKTGLESHTGVYVLLPGHEACYDSKMGLKFDGHDDMFML